MIMRYKERNDMTAKEKFEFVVTTIEQLIEENELSDREISKKAFYDAGMPIDERSRNVLFGFLLEKKVLEYISERRYMIGYKVLLTEKDKKRAYSTAEDLANACDRQYFINRFKDRFNRLTPLQARELNDVSLYQAVPTWDSISEIGEKGENNMKDTIFGIPKDQFILAQEALNLQDFYGLNEVESEFAFSLICKDINLDAAFEYTFNYLGGNISEDRDNRLKEDLSREDVKYLYFNCGFGFGEILNILLMQYLKQFDGAIKDFDRRFLKGCSDYSERIKLENWAGQNENDFLSKEKTYQDKVDYFIEHKTDKYTDMDFELYLFYLKYYNFTEAFSMIKPGLDDETKMRRIMKNVEEIPDISFPEEDEIEFEPRDVYEPEVWDEDFAYPIEEEYDMDEDEFFDVDEFEQLCDAMAEVSEAEISETSKAKRLNPWVDLDVEKYWKMLTSPDETIDNLPMYF